MWRYFGVAFIICVIVTGIVAGVDEAGGFDRLDEELRRIYGAVSQLEEGEDIIAGFARYVVAGLLALAVAWTTIDVPRISLKLTIGLCAAFLTCTLSPTLALHGVYFEPFSGVLAILLSLVLGLFYGGTEKGQRKRVFRSMLGNRVSGPVFSKLISLPEPPALDGETRECTVLTCRVFNHHELQEELEPRDTVGITNLFLESTTEFLLGKGAYLDESSPDSVRAFFGMPLENPEHAVVACRVAIELRQRLDNLSRQSEATWFRPLNYGIAITTGQLTIGVYGTSRERYFSGLGSEIDFTRRLSSANRYYGSRILIGARTAQLAADDVEVRPMEMLYLPEAHLMLEVYELLGIAGSLSIEEIERRNAFWRGVIHYREGKLLEAQEMFALAEPPDGADPPLAYYKAQIEERLSDPSDPSDKSDPSDSADSADSTGPGDELTLDL